MKLTKEQIEQFKSFCETGQALTIYGFNDLAQLFQTTARISRYENDKPAVDNSMMFFEYGKKQSDRPYAEFVAPFTIDYEPDGFTGIHLIVDKICLDNGEVVYQNPESDKYLKIAQKANEEEQEKLRKAGRDLTELDPVTAKLRDSIGKPVILDGRSCGVLSSVGGSNDFGGAMFTVRDATLVGGISVDSDSVFETCDVNGVKSIVAINGFSYEEDEEIARIVKDRMNRIAKANDTVKSADNTEISENGLE